MLVEEMEENIILGLSVAVIIFRGSPDVLSHDFIYPGRATWNLTPPAVGLTNASEFLHKKGSHGVTKDMIS